MSVPFATADVAVGDFNKDGKLDVAVSIDNRDLSIFLGNGDGTFAARMDQPLGLNINRIVAVDLNNDGNLDLVASSMNADDVVVLMGNGDGTFKPDVGYAATLSPYSLVVGDFNNDGKKDVISTGTSDSRMAYLIGRGDGTFLEGDDISVPFAPIVMTTGHFFGNPSILDLAIGCGGSTDALYVLQGNGDGTFQPAKQVESGVDPGALTAGDVNGDGKDDLIFFTQQTGLVQVFLGHGDGTFKKNATYTAGLILSNSTEIQLADLRNTGKLDLIAANPQGNDVSVLLGDGDGTFQPATNYTVGSIPTCLTVGDFNRDGHLDVISGDYDSNDIEYLQGNGNGTLVAGIGYYSGPDNAPALASADLNHDGYSDVVSVAQNNVYVLLGNGDNTFQPPIIYAAGTTMLDVQIADVNRDGKPDIITANEGSPDTAHSISVLLGNGDGTFQSPLYVAADMSMIGIATGDFNNDGKLDIAGVDGNNRALSVLFGNGDGTFQKAVKYSTGTDPNRIVTGDFNRDGKLDIAITVYHADPGQNVAVYFNQGGGTFGLPALYAGDGTQGLIATDLTGSGNLDLVYASDSNLLIDLMNDGSGGFPVSNAYRSFARPMGVAALNYDDDGIPDVAVANQSSGTITVFRGHGDGTFDLVATYFGGGNTPSDIVADDLSGDGAMDLLVAGQYIAVLPGQSSAVYFLLTAQAAPLAGIPCPFTITAINTAGQTITGYSGTVHFASNSPGAKLPADITLVNGQATVNVTFPADGNFYLRATDTANNKITGTSHFVTVTGVAQPIVDHFQVTTPASATAGTSFSFTVTAVDNAGLTVPGYNGLIHFAGSDPSALLPADASLTNGTGTFSATLKTAAIQTISVNDVQAPTTKGTSSGISVSAATAEQFSVSGPASSASGAQFTVTIRVKDSFGNICTNYAGTIHFSSTDSATVLPADFTFGAGDQGIHSFQVTLKTQGPQSISVADIPGGTVVGNLDLSVTAPTLASFDISGPSSAVAGVPGSYTISARDSLGNVVTGFSGTIAFTSSDSQAVLPTNYTFVPADQGSHTFNLTFKTGGLQSINVADSADGVHSQTNVVVSASTIAKLGVTGLSGGATAGSPINVTVTGLDAFGNPVDTLSDAIHFATSDAHATLPPDYSFVGTDHGSHTFAITFTTAGSQSLIITDKTNSGITGFTGQLAVSWATASTLTISTVNTAIAGSAISVTVSMLDSFGNLVRDYLGTLHFSSTDGQAVLPANYTFVSSDQGTKTFGSIRLKTAGQQTVTGAVTGGSLTATSGPVAVTAGPVAALTFVQQPTTGISGTTIAPSVTVRLQDSFGNLVSTDSTQVTLVLSPGQSQAKLGGTTTVAATGGIATFSSLTVSGAGIGLVLNASVAGGTNTNSQPFNMVVESNILPVVVAPVIFGPKPNASQTEAFVKGVYRTLLGRDADSSGLGYWIGRLSAGAARSTIIGEFWNSPENRGREVDDYYRSFLGRTADTSGRNYWISQLQQGADETAIVFSFLLSPEELQATDEVFVQRLYQGALGRTASAQDIGFWRGQLAGGITRQQVATSFVFSAEAAGVAVDSFYAAYFQRRVDNSGRSYWVDQISNRKSSYATLPQVLLASDEFFADALANVP